MIPRRKLYYPTGLLSLALLPMLCMWTLKKYHVFDDLRVLVITWPERFKGADSSFYPIYKTPDRVYLDINLTGNSEEDNIKLDFAQLEIRSMIATHNTIKGVHFHFSKEAKYRSFVRTINICKIENANQYIASGNNIWVLNTISLQNAEQGSPLSGCIVNSIIEIKTERTMSEKIRNIAGITEPYLPSMVIFVFMILLTIKQVYNLSNS